MHQLDYRQSPGCVSDFAGLLAESREARNAKLGKKLFSETLLLQEFSACL